MTNPSRNPRIAKQVDAEEWQEEQKRKRGLGAVRCGDGGRKFGGRCGLRQIYILGAGFVGLAQLPGTQKIKKRPGIFLGHFGFYLWVTG